MCRLCVPHLPTFKSLDDASITNPIAQRHAQGVCYVEEQIEAALGPFHRTMCVFRYLDGL
jgi:hypothetical protein